MINITKYNIIITVKVECEPKACTSLNKMINYKLFQLFKVIKRHAIYAVKEEISKDLRL